MGSFKDYASADSQSVRGSHDRGNSLLKGGHEEVVRLQARGFAEEGPEVSVSLQGFDTYHRKSECLTNTRPADKPAKATGR